MLSRVLDFPLNPSVIFSSSVLSLMVLPQLCCLSVTCKERYHLAYNKIEYKLQKWCSTIHVQFKENSPTQKRKQYPRHLSLNFIKTNFFSFEGLSFHQRRETCILKNAQDLLLAGCAFKSEAVSAGHCSDILNLKVNISAFTQSGQGYWF